MEKTKKATKTGKCVCPFCEEELQVTTPPFCQACGVTIQYCLKCEAPAPKNAKVCPKCGGRLTSR